jgi:site-specific recombinase XerD
VAKTMSTTANNLREYIKNGIVRKKTRKEEFRTSETTEENRDEIIRFDNSMMARGLEQSTRVNYMVVIHDLAEWLGGKSFSEATEDDINEYFSDMKRRGCKNSSISSVKTRIKTFYIQMYGETGDDGNTKSPKCVARLKPGKSFTRVTKDTILTPEEIKKMIEKADTFRDKAIISGLFESACRISEYMNIQKKNMMFDKQGIQVTVKGKKGPRTVRLVNSVPYILEWLKIHPSWDSSESYLWVNFSRTQPNNIGKKLKYNGFYMVLKSTARRAGIKKNVYPHLLRHSRLTEIGYKLSDPVLKRFAGWKMNSNMPQVYLHLNGKDTDKTILRNVYGIEDETNTDKDVLVPKTCINCGHKNMFELSFCTECGSLLDESSVDFNLAKKNGPVSNMDTILEKVLQNKLDGLLERKLEQMLSSKVNQMV